MQQGGTPEGTDDDDGWVAHAVKMLRAREMRAVLRARGLGLERKLTAEQLENLFALSEEEKCKGGPASSPETDEDESELRRLTLARLGSWRLGELQGLALAAGLPSDGTRQALIDRLIGARVLGNSSPVPPFSLLSFSPNIEIRPSFSFSS